MSLIYCTSSRPNIPQFGIEKNADEIGTAVAGGVGAAIAAHAAVTAIKRLQNKGDQA